MSPVKNFRSRNNDRHTDTLIGTLSARHIIDEWHDTWAAIVWTNTFRPKDRHTHNTQQRRPNYTQTHRQTHRQTICNTREIYLVKWVPLKTFAAGIMINTQTHTDTSAHRQTCCRNRTVPSVKCALLKVIWAWLMNIQVIKPPFKNNTTNNVDTLYCIIIHTFILQTVKRSTQMLALVGYWLTALLPQCSESFVGRYPLPEMVPDMSLDCVHCFVI